MLVMGEVVQLVAVVVPLVGVVALVLVVVVPLVGVVASSIPGVVSCPIPRGCPTRGGRPPR